MKSMFLNELEREKENTLAVLSRLSSSEFAYKPHPKSMSLGELANHIVELHNWVEWVINRSEFNFHTDYTPSTIEQIDDLILVLKERFEKNKELLEQVGDTVFSEIWTLKAGEHVIASLPKSAALRFIVTNHLIHHRGQLTVYMRMLDIPVPGVYGPSADDQAK